jgi:hypothetical protein
MISGDTWDVVILGSGIAGLAGALAAHELGLRPVVLEKASTLGGGTVNSYGLIWVGQNHLAQAAGYSDTRDEVVAYMRFLGGGSLDDDRMRTFVDRSPEGDQGAMLPTRNINYGRGRTIARGPRAPAFLLRCNHSRCAVRRLRAALPQAATTAQTQFLALTHHRRTQPDLDKPLDLVMPGEIGVTRPVDVVEGSVCHGSQKSLVMPA